LTVSLTTKTFVTSDIAIAAYLQTHGFKLVDCKRLSDGRFYFEFEDPADECRQKSVEFLSSECCQFDNNVRNLKKILYKS
jgi:hypothetical protein